MRSGKAALNVYSTIFKQHLDETQRHLHGGSLDAVSTEPPSTISSVLWTPTEMDAFFHALSIHSRFHPDLIAACVGTKNVLEVIEYLKALEEGSQRYAHGRPSREDLPAAREMSKDWVTWEEKQAELLRVSEFPDTSRLDRDESTEAEDNGTYQRSPSPISRRRFQKRMYMRRRRARERGEMVNMTPSLLKPGRRNKATVSQAPDQVAGKAEEDVLANLPVYDTGATSTGSGIDSPNEERLINVPNLRNFLRFHTGLYDKRLLNGGEDIDAHVIDALAAMTRDFVSEVICRIVVLSEEKSKMKGSIKVWRQRNDQDNNTIKPSIIQACLETMEFSARTRKLYFQKLLASFDTHGGGVVSVASATSGDELVPPIHPGFLPDALAASNDGDLLSDNNDTDFQDDQSIDREDALGDQTYEDDLWDQVYQEAEVQ